MRESLIYRCSSLAEVGKAVFVVTLRYRHPMNYHMRLSASPSVKQSCRHDFIQSITWESPDSQFASKTQRRERRYVTKNAINSSKCSDVFQQQTRQL